MTMRIILPIAEILYPWNVSLRV